MSSSKLRDLQLVELRLLDEFNFICEKHELRHYMIGGTLLGAVRHQGFIPWDDDVDMCMPREDYEKFLEVVEGELPEGMYFSSIYNNVAHRSGFARLCTSEMRVLNHAISNERIDDAWIDVFPLDGFPSNPILGAPHKLRLFFWRAMSRVAQFEDAVDVTRKRGFFESLLVRCAALPVFRCFSDYNRYFKNLDHALKAYGYDESKIAINYDGGIGFSEKFPRACYGEGRLYLFEGRQVWGPLDPDPVLQAIYGPGYMTPPPESERNWHNTEVLEESESME
ncbi:LicD family protein [Arabiibacter massiliensis]|uniref:LicD family protein n=1 Tax=Arabiibacter massiliensis TaxID=1870985 RepID=UPI00117A4967|nr:LicD family protein [Arabiibacter massiliensis]